MLFIKPVNLCISNFQLDVQMPLFLMPHSHFASSTLKTISVNGIFYAYYPTEKNWFNREALYTKAFRTNMLLDTYINTLAVFRYQTTIFKSSFAASIVLHKSRRCKILLNTGHIFSISYYKCTSYILFHKFKKKTV